MSSEENPCRVSTPLCRLSYPNLFVPTAIKEGDQKKYGCELIFAKNADLSAMKAAAKAAFLKKWPSNGPKSWRNPFRSGDEFREGKAGYEGSIFIGARDKNKPQIVIGRNKTPCDDPSQVYGGQYVIANVTAFGYDNAGNKGVGFALNAIWVIRDGEAFGNRFDARTDFDSSDIDPSMFGGDDTDKFDEDLFGDGGDGETMPF